MAGDAAQRVQRHPHRRRHDFGHQAHALQAHAGHRRGQCGQGSRDEEELQGNEAGLPAVPGGQRHPQNRQPPVRGGLEYHRPAKDH